MPKPSAVDIDQHIGTRVKRFRQREGVSASALAEAIESTQQQISRYENGQNKLSAAQLFRIAESLGIPVAWFFQGFEGEARTSLTDGKTHYEEAFVKEDLRILESMWPKLNEAQRAAVLRLLDTLLCE